MNRDVKDLVRELEAQGFEVRRSKKNHLKVYGLDGRLVTTLPATPSDHRWKRNALSVLRKAGFRS